MQVLAPNPNMSNGRPAGGVRVRRSAVPLPNIARRVVLVEIQHVDGGYEERAAGATKRIEKHAALQDGCAHHAAYGEQYGRRVPIVKCEAGGFDDDELELGREIIKAKSRRFDLR
ncbi:hypothetical protein HC256_009297 [Beauveria bassiana]|nr:hypothetical protein HC256_009297 [Beauveria bassiana]